MSRYSLCFVDTLGLAGLMVLALTCQEPETDVCAGTHPRAHESTEVGVANVRLACLSHFLGILLEVDAGLSV